MLFRLNKIIFPAFGIGLLSYLVLNCFFFGCQMQRISKLSSDQDTLYPFWHGGIIKHFGLYTFQKKGLELEVQKNNDLIEFKLKNKKGKILVRSPKNLTIYEKWSIYLDKKSNIWLHSSDIGNLEWICNKDSYQKRILKDGDEELAGIPEEFKMEIEP